MTKYLLLLMTVLPLALLGCPSDDDDDSGAGDDDVADDDDAADEFEAGQFTFSTHAVDDGCLGGAAEAIYMPEGPGVPRVWEDPIELPSFDSLPTTYTIQLPDPLDSMEITVEAGATEGQFVMNSGELNDTLFDEDNYPNCTVDSAVSSVLNVQTNDHLSGTVTLENTDYQGDTCPVPDGDPCTVVLDIQADRI